MAAKEDADPVFTNKFQNLLSFAFDDDEDAEPKAPAPTTAPTHSHKKNNLLSSPISVLPKAKTTPVSVSDDERR
ncbi:hypothetical protein PINS_up011738 [Pythium insidiosum]|nr:hypothetical protein PINS_up011738 [Pythium insidiosum]